MAPDYARSAKWLDPVEIVVVHPEIPQNSGCAARLAAALGLRLHLVEPLGFSLADRYLKRAGLDYWPLVELSVHPSIDVALRALEQRSARPLEERLHLFTARGGRSLFQTDFAPDDVLVFGCESRGLPPSLLERHPARRVYIPIRAGVRSLNLANAISIAVYTALVRAGMPLPDNDGEYVPHPQAQSDVWPHQRATLGADEAPL
jgi:tRNA (cytidine/uridine-2'-O-)-methyltransferase